MRSTLVSRLAGAALLIPALLVWLLALVIPTVRLIVMSLQDTTLLRRGREPKFVGFDNYKSVLENGAVEAILYGASLAVLPLLIFFLAGPLMGWAASNSPALASRVVRVALVLPVAAFVPAGAAYAWLMRSGPRGMPKPDQLALQTRLALAFAVFGLVCAIAVTVYGSVFRAARQTRLPAALAVSGIAVLTALAIGIQQFGIGRVAPSSGTVTPETLMFAQSFVSARLGPGAAIAGIELLVLAILGLLAACIVIFTGLRIGVTARSEEPRQSRPAAAIGLIVGAVIIVGLSAYFLLPWIGGLGNKTDVKVAPDLVGSWIAPLMTTVVGVGLAALGGFGIGVLRPLGRNSELLLLPFAPWLFTGTGPAMPPAVVSAIENAQLGTFWAKFPPLWIFVPALFLFTMLLRGLAEREGGNVSKFLPALPAIDVAAVGFWLLQAQDFLWSLTMSTRPPFTAPAAFTHSIVASAYRSNVDGVAYSVLTPLWLIPVVVIVAAAAQWFLADRVVLVTSTKIQR